MFVSNKKRLAKLLQHVSAPSASAPSAFVMLFKPCRERGKSEQTRFRDVRDVEASARTTYAQPRTSVQHQVLVERRENVELHGKDAEKKWVVQRKASPGVLFACFAGAHVRTVERHVAVACANHLILSLPHECSTAGHAGVQRTHGILYKRGIDPHQAQLCARMRTPTNNARTCR